MDGPESLPQRTKTCQRAANIPLRPGIRPGRCGATHLTLSHEQLDRARRAWLADLQQAYQRAPSAENALRLAGGEWKCGEYAAAVRHFVVARDLAPGNPEAHIALVHAASMTGQQALENDALTRALRLHPRASRLQLHAARRLIPADWTAARALLQPVLHDGVCALFDQAIAAIQEGRRPALETIGDTRERAKVEGLHWVMDHSNTDAVHAGLPTQVMFRALAAAPDSGLTLECGVYYGRSLRLIADGTKGWAHGFDSFQGLPEAWNADEGAGAYSTGGRLPAMPDNVVLHAGWFEETLPPFFATHPGPIRLLHIDCDIYSSTCTVLAHAAERLVPGSMVVFDDYLGYPGYEKHELRAFEEFARRLGIGWELIAANLLGREVAIRIVRR